MKKAILGIDLSGTSNTRDTCALLFSENRGYLKLEEVCEGATDNQLLEIAVKVQGSLAVGIDAPLSYNPGGGYRPADRELGRLSRTAGLHPGSVMVPTLTRMVYLTLRGITLARSLQLTRPTNLHIVEVHPGATLALRGAAIEAIRSFKHTREARGTLLSWLSEQGLEGIKNGPLISDHYVAAAAAALAAWGWRRKEIAWLAPAEPPFHPFDYAC